ncbi:MAG: adenylate synthase [Verrucomicrobia bacterium]|nr:adenylate synthase [Verrucomicrobiota bacterium]
MSSVLETLLIAWHFARRRWGPRPRSRAALLAQQSRRLRRFLARVARHSPVHRGRRAELADFPVIGKAEFLADFAGLNRFGLPLAEATDFALRAERARDFRPQWRGHVTIGLSSGTSGSRQVFLVSRVERCRWAGFVFADLLEPAALRRILTPWAPPLRLAFFLRAGSNLYGTLSRRRVRFDHYDLTRPFAELVRELRTAPPDVLIAPATVLAQLAEVAGELRPRQIVSVAEVLDTRDRARIEAVFGVRVAEVYQAAEGFLATTCEHGRLHLHEDLLHCECDWLDEKRDRFQPIVTDFTRRSQWLVRYRLTDILRAGPESCPCGRATRTLAAIEGRAEEVLWARDAAGSLAPVFPDALRQALYALPESLDLYRLEQHGEGWEMRLRRSEPGLEAAVRAALEKLLAGLALRAPEIVFRPWTDQPAGEKQKRIRCLQRPA